MKIQIKLNHFDWWHRGLKVLNKVVNMWDFETAVQIDINLYKNGTIKDLFFVNFNSWIKTSEGQLLNTLQVHLRHCNFPLAKLGNTC